MPHHLCACFTKDFASPTIEVLCAVILSMCVEVWGMGFYLCVCTSHHLCARLIICVHVSPFVCVCVCVCSNMGFHGEHGVCEGAAWVLLMS
jgi:hypothetical protein